VNVSGLSERWKGLVGGCCGGCNKGDGVKSGISVAAGGRRLCSGGMAAGLGKEGGPVSIDLGAGACTRATADSLLFAISLSSCSRVLRRTGACRTAPPSMPDLLGMVLPPEVIQRVAR